MDNSERTRVGNNLGISNGEVPGITLGAARKIKFGADERSGPCLSVDLLMVQGMATLRVGVKILMNQHFDVH